ncbi:DUF4062 domain-containing protein [Tunturiibacter lichenicola]|uniref:DUF4062 domain-containing protein n=1 Tax=Tunturiibacter lichenicola TaxID=2051959 RepID=UPI003D9ABEB0
MDEVRYQIFVSSTFKDLKEEREKVLQAILELKAFPAGMELFPSADEEQFEFIKREIDSSDYYIVIVAGRYGSVDKDGTSYTEKEYDYAVKNNKPVLRFLHYDTQKLTGEKLEPLDIGKEKLKAFRAKVQSNRLCKEYENPDDLKSKVLTSLVSQFNLKPMRGWVRSGQTARDVLESVNRLQQHVIELEAENLKLRELQTDTVSRLAGGEETVSWSLDMNGFNFNNRWPKNRDPLVFESTWDEMLEVAFPGGSSHVLANNVEQNIGRLILSRLNAQSEDRGLWEAAEPYLKKDHHYFPELKPVKLVLNDIHRQFAGLGFLEENMETIYIDQSYGAAPSPKTMSVWKLTPRGQTHMAMMRGHLRDEV